MSLREVGLSPPRQDLKLSLLSKFPFERDPAPNPSFEIEAHSQKFPGNVIMSPGMMFQIELEFLTFYQL
jgi:hypothetical protein